MITRTEAVDRFRAVSEDGTEVVLVVYQDYVHAGHPQDPRSEIKTRLQRIKTIEGFAVNARGDDTYEIVNLPMNPELVVRRA